MDADELALLAAIRADPDADGPRLVYADWLLARGDVRGELIVAQCELARGTLDDERYDAVRRRAGAVPAVPEMTYDVELPADCFAVGDPPLWSRGFVPAQMVSCDAGKFAANKDELFRNAPCARELRLWDFDDDDEIGAVVADPDIVRWGGLRSVPLRVAPALAQHAHVDALRSLLFEADEDDAPALLDPLIDAGRLPQLESLEIRGMVIDGNLPYLAAAPAERWRAAAFAPTLRAFRGEMLDALDAFPRLEEYATGFYGGQLEQFGDHAVALRRLALGPESASYDPAEPVMTMSGLARLFAAPCMATCEVLELDAERSEPHAADAWRGLDRLPLRGLSIIGGVVDDGLVRALAEGPRLGRVRGLRLDHHDRTNEAVMRALFAAHDWPQLEELDIGQTPRSVAFVGEVLERMPALRRLCIGADDLNAVLSLDAMQRLEVIEVYADRTTSELPDRPFAHVKLMQIHSSSRSTQLHDEIGRHWGLPRRLQIMPTNASRSSRGRAALTLVRLAGFETWSRSFLRL